MIAATIYTVKQWNNNKFKKKLIKLKNNPKIIMNLLINSINKLNPCCYNKPLKLSKFKKF